MRSLWPSWARLPLRPLSAAHRPAMDRRRAGQRRRPPPGPLPVPEAPPCPSRGQVPGREGQRGLPCLSDLDGHQVGRPLPRWPGASPAPPPLAQVPPADTPGAESALQLWKAALQPIRSRASLGITASCGSSGQRRRAGGELAAGHTVWTALPPLAGPGGPSRPVGLSRRPGLVPADGEIEKGGDSDGRGHHLCLLQLGSDQPLG